MFFEKNCEALAKNPQHQPVIEALKETPLPDNLEIYQANDGGVTLEYHGHFLHNTESPEREAKLLCATGLTANPKGMTILIGMGIGYLLEEVYANTLGKIIMVETDLPILRFAMEHVDCTKYLNSKRVTFVATKEQLANHLYYEFMAGDALSMLALPGYVQWKEDEIKELAECVREIAEGTLKNTSLEDQFSQAWMSQFYKNLRYIPNALPVDTLKGSASGKPAIVVSSGPSLDDAIPQLKELQDKAVLIAVGGALHPLLAQGITPDYAVFIDYQGPSQQLQNLPGSTEDIQFILSPFVDSICHEVPSKARYVVSYDYFPMGPEWFDERLNFTQSHFSTGTSVSILAYQMAHWMGCSSICLVGQDLAFRGTQQYAGNIHATINEDGRAILEDSDTMVGRDVATVTVTGQKGEQLTSTQDYTWIIEQLKVLAKRNQALPQPAKLYNASDGGANIHGFKNVSLSEWQDEAGITQPSEKPQVPAGNIAPDSLREKVKAGIEETLTHLGQLNTLSQSLTQAIDTLINTPPPSWKHVAPKYDSCRKELIQSLEESPSVFYAVKADLLKITQNYNPDNNTTAQIRKNLRLDRDHFKNAISRLNTEVRPILDETLVHLK